MKKILSLILSLVCLLGLVTATSCNPKSNAKINIVCTIFPQYNWVYEIAKGVDDVNITYISNSGVDLHSYQPSVKDIANISSCDLFIYVGGESEAWVIDALTVEKNKNRKIIKLLDVLKDRIKEEESIEGMEEHEEEIEYDEHVWLSLKNATIACEYITKTLSIIDSENKDVYFDNFNNYKNKLLDMDSKYASAVSAGTKSILLFGDRFPFRYLTDDYGLTYYAAFSGCSAESEASFETIKFLSEKVDELGLSVILTIEGNNNGIAQTIKDNTKLKNQKILVMNSMQSITSKDVEKGVTYLSIMQDNLLSFSEALK